MYLTYFDFVRLGGSIPPDTNYDDLEYNARKTIDKYTQLRLSNTEYSDIDNDVKKCMYKLIILQLNYSDTQEVSSFQNGDVTVNFNVGDASSYEKEERKICELCLSDELLFRGIY